jgi:O-methyltransferase
MGIFRNSLHVASLVSLALAGLFSPACRARFEKMRQSGKVSGPLPDYKVAEILSRIDPYTMVHPTSVSFAIQEAARLAIEGHSGAIVECGSWRGGTSIAMLLAQRAAVGRVVLPVFLLDSFEGLPPAQERDGPLAIEWQSGAYPEWFFDNCFADESEVKEVARSFGFSESEARIRRGWFSETIPKIASELGANSISLLRLDGDWYDSTILCLEHLVPIVQEGATVIVDDYYAWDGCARALHDWLSHHDHPYRIKSLYLNLGAFFVRRDGRTNINDI